MFPPGVVDRIEFTSNYSLQLSIVICLYMSPWKNMFLSHVACPCDYIQFELMRNLLI